MSNYHRHHDEISCRKDNNLYFTQIKRYLQKCSYKNISNHNDINQLN